MKAEASGVVVGTGDGCLVITELQTPGKRRLLVRDYLAGHMIQPGEQLG
jgi:methionyl-tRNA formyltransferase